MGLFDIFKPKKKTFWEKMGDGIVSAGKTVGKAVINTASKKMKETYNDKELWSERYSTFSPDQLLREKNRFRSLTLGRKTALKEEMEFRGIWEH